MMVAWRYKPRDTLIQRLDPRSRFIFLGCLFAAFAIGQVWDIRVVVPLFLLSVILLLMARIDWADIRRPILFFLVFIILIVGINGLLSGRGGPSIVRDHDTSEVLVNFTPFILFGWEPAVTITKVRILFAITQVLRMLTMALLAIPIPYTIDPVLYGVAFRQMGMPDKPAFTMDLAFRFIPTLARDFNITLDAQRARGYELDHLKGGLVAKIRRLAPLFVPITMQSIFNGEEVIDAIDLRGFGVRPRTWMRKLTYAPRDWAFISLGVAILIASIIARVLGFGDFWFPPAWM